MKTDKYAKRVRLRELFEPYEKIQESAAAFPTSTCPWYVTEKVHGANFSLLTDGQRVYPASRKGLLSKEAQKTFFGMLELLPSLSKQAKALFSDVLDVNPDTAAICIFGELFGGNRYPGYDPGLSPVSPVQEGILYSPLVSFMVFDISVISIDGGRFYLPFSDTISLCAAKDVQLPTVPVLYRGPRVQCMEYEAGRESLVPALLGYPSPPCNTAEGIVIRPDVPLYDGQGQRCMLKRKVARFSELEAHTLPRLSAPEALAEAELLRRAVPARLDAVQSKLGLSVPVSDLCHALVDDCLEHFHSSGMQEALDWWWTKGGGGKSPDGERIMQRLRCKCALLVGQRGR
ncbi:hypothetical protein KIPB_003384 [Kipferlia bialata]|uniref:RNA ligase domain-containing protein n=1 Tax=Kipferlia bialata TaxID=797122 RepID=A0A9K3CS54_9EUKA|nr:hypothetical protein KIPB_003384 [Kipferlia bialata]|eukprot:g3384.t1